jgi:hypothetical protein
MTEIRTIKISGREFQVEGPTPRYGTYLLTGPRGATYIAVPAYANAPGIFKVLGGRSVTELRIAGNVVRLTHRGGDLRQATQADIDQAVAEHKTGRRGPVVNGEQFAPGYTPEAAAYEQSTRVEDTGYRLTPEQVAANALERREITRLRSSSGEPWNRPLSPRADCTHPIGCEHYS